MLLAMSLELGTAYEPAEFETQIAGVTYKLVHYVNLNKLEKKTKKLFTVSPEQTPVLFGYRNYFAPKYWAIWQHIVEIYCRCTQQQNYCTSSQNACQTITGYYTKKDNETKTISSSRN